MGLGTIELVMNIEDDFGIQVPDEDAEKLRTVGQTVDYLLRVLNLEPRRVLADPTCCPSRSIFYDLRRQFLDNYCHCVPARLFRPDSRLSDMVPSDTLRARWDRFARAVGLPPLPVFPWLRARAWSPDATVFIRRYTDPAGVFGRLRKIIAKQLRIEPASIQWHSDYIRDLHMD